MTTEIHHTETETTITAQLAELETARVAQLTADAYRSGMRMGRALFGPAANEPLLLAEAGDAS
jgi:hypothetical protein